MIDALRTLKCQRQLYGMAIEGTIKRKQRLCRLGALKSTFPATMQSELPETGGGAGRPA
jgi:hypothetical protein